MQHPAPIHSEPILADTEPSDADCAQFLGDIGTPESSTSPYFTIGESQKKLKRMRPRKSEDVDGFVAECSLSLAIFCSVCSNLVKYPRQWFNEPWVQAARDRPEWPMLERRFECPFRIEVVWMGGRMKDGPATSQSAAFPCCCRWSPGGRALSKALITSTQFLQKTMFSCREPFCTASMRGIRTTVYSKIAIINLKVLRLFKTQKVETKIRTKLYVRKPAFQIVFHRNRGRNTNMIVSMPE